MQKRFLFVFLFLVSFMSINTAKAFEYSGFGIRAVDLKTGTAKQDSSGFLYKIELGSSKKGGFMVINNTKVKKTFLVYTADSTPSTDGGFACKQFLEDKKDVGAWIKLSKSEVTLEPGTNEIISFDISVPNTKIDSGEHNGCFLVQEKKENTTDQSKSGIQLSIRTGVRVSVIIPGDLSKKISIDKFALNKKSNNFIFNVAVKNEGNISSNTDVRVIVQNVLGLPHKKLGGEYVILRDETSVWNFTLPKPFWGGFYKAKLSVKYNPNTRDSLEDTKNLITLESDKTITFFSFPTTRGLIIEVLILLFIAFNIYLLYIWKKRQDWIKTWKDYKVARSTNIKVLAEKFDVNWKLLASVNKIKAPFMVDSKDELRVPNDLEEDFYNKSNSKKSIKKSPTKTIKKTTKKKSK